LNSDAEKKKKMLRNYRRWR